MKRGMYFFVASCFVMMFMVGIILTTMPRGGQMTIPRTPSSIGPCLQSTKAGSSDPAGDEWPMFRGALNHTGVTTTTPVKSAGPLWTFTTGGDVDSAPAIDGGRVYVGCNDNKTYCLNATTGALISSYATGAHIYHSSPAVADGRVYVGSEDHGVYCLNATTTALIWKFNTNYFVESSPAVASGRVYVGSDDGKLYCLNAITGGLNWSYPIGLAGASSPAVVNGRVYTGSSNGSFYCLNATNGKRFWNCTMGNDVESSPAVASGRVYVGSDDGKLYCFDAITGTIYWSYLTGGAVASSPAVAGGRVYVGSGDEKIYCFDAITGTFIWSYRTMEGVSSSPAIAGNRVFVGSGDNITYCLDATTGALVWSYATSGYVYSSPAIAAGRVYVGCWNNKLYCLPMVTVPTAPQNLQFNSTKNGEMLTWQAPGNGDSPITSYMIYQGGTQGGEILVAMIGNVTSYSLANLSDGQYFFKVRAVNGVGAGALSDEKGISFATTYVSPFMPGYPAGIMLGLIAIACTVLAVKTKRKTW
ncbi:MAG TPA: PQQ-binding-like beta-propeller repeat protein [Candidatus Lokiarchaeia archaeon]|nr:PQQ-binding-like beta-propeller repeat protein [Candidatus Lokiarchaeia archaeon]